MLPLIILFIFAIFLYIFGNKKRKQRGGQPQGLNVRLLPDGESASGILFDSPIYWMIFIVIIILAILGIVAAFK